MHSMPRTDPTGCSDAARSFHRCVQLTRCSDICEKAERKLGDSFDAKEFHQLILDTGIVPFEIMEEELDNYIAGKKGR